MTYLYSHCKVCAWVVAIAIAISGSSVLAVNQYNDNFETDLGDWGAAAGTVVTTNLQDGMSWVPASEPNAAGTDVMYVAQDADATNATPVTSGTSSNVWIDMWIAPNLYDGVATNRDFSEVSGSAVAFFFDTNGHVVVNQGSGSTNWTIITTDHSGDAVVTTDNDASPTNMQRTTVYMNYANDTWDLFLQGRLVQENLDFNTSKSQLERITLSDDVYADMITVSATNYPSADTWAAGVTLDSDEDGDGMDDAYELHYFGDIASHYSSTDTDGDGRTDGEEYLDGTDPTDSNDKSWVIPYFEKFAGVASVPTNITDSYRAFTKLAGNATVTDTSLSAMGDSRGIALSSGGISVVVSNTAATNVFCQVYVQPVPCTEIPTTIVDDEAAAICVVTNTLYVWNDTAWEATSISGSQLTNGTWIGLAAHLDYNAQKWDLYYSADNTFVTDMTKVNTAPLDFNNGYSGSGKFTELIITNESSVTAHVDAVAVSLSYSPTHTNYTNLVIFERAEGEDQILAMPPYTYANQKIIDGGTTRFGQDLSIGLFPGDEILTPAGETYELAASGVWSTLDTPTAVTNAAEGLLLTRLPGSDTLAFYPYSNVVAWSSQAEAKGTNDAARGRTDLVVPATFPGGCIDINENDSMGFDSGGSGDPAHQWDEILFYNTVTKKTRKFQYVLSGTNPQASAPGDWLYKGTKVGFTVCPGDSFMYYNKQSGDITWVLSN